MNLRTKLCSALTALLIPLSAAAAASSGGTAGWPEHSRLLAESIIQEYGAPDEVQPSLLSWTGRRPWIRMIVHRDAEDSDRPADLEQSVAYEVPIRKWRALTAFGRGVDYDPVDRELSARTGGEKSNLLALNLADEIIRGRRTPEEAREFYDKTVSLSLSGKSSPYMRRLHFVPAWADMKSK